MRAVRLGLVVTSLVAAQSAAAQSMFVRAPAQYLGYGYGNSSWTTFTGMWDARFGAANITTGSSIGSLAGYSALLLDANQPFGGAQNLTAGEVTEIQSFLAGGGRLYAFGENDSWSSWNQNVLSMFGATFGGLGANVGTPLVSNVLTTGVTSINTPAPGYISNFNGGVDLFSNSIAGLFGSNALVVLDINICAEGTIDNADNRIFCQNIVNFTAGDPLDPGDIGVVPEPATFVTLAMGLGGLFAVRRYRRRQN